MATIRYAVEQALVSYLTDAELGVDVVAGLSVEEKSLPAVFCTAVEWAEDELNLNWYRVKCTVETKATTAYTAAAFDTLCSAVAAALRISDLGTELQSAGDGLTIVAGGIGAPDSGEFSAADDIWTETRTLEIYCALTG